MVENKWHKKYSTQSTRTTWNIKTTMEHNRKWDNHKLLTTHTITLDTDNRKTTVIRKNDLAIVTQPLTSQQRQTSPPKRLIHMIACKSLREYNNNKEKIKQFCLEEKRQMKQRQQQMTRGPSTTATKTPDGENNQSVQS